MDAPDVVKRRFRLRRFRVGHGKTQVAAQFWIDPVQQPCAQLMQLRLAAGIEQGHGELLPKPLGFMQHAPGLLVLAQHEPGRGFDADVAITTGELQKLIRDLIFALGGEGRTELNSTGGEA